MPRIIMIALSGMLLLLLPCLDAGAEERAFGRIIPPEKRVALVIGNNDYAHAEKLKNAVADALAMRRSLEALGFDVVYRQNAGRREMNRAVDEFVAKLSTDTVGLLFYAGHGVQIKSANVLMPVDIQAEKENDLLHDGIEVTRILEQMAETRAKFSLMILDACRDNPFKGQGSRGLGVARGLTAPSSPASGIMVVYAAGANQKALDRLSDKDTDPNGLFTREFLKGMRTPGRRVQEVVNDVKMAVIEKARSVGHEQTPAIYDQSEGTFVFLPKDGMAASKLENGNAPMQVSPAQTSSVQTSPAPPPPPLAPPPPPPPPARDLVEMDSERVVGQPSVNLRAEPRATSRLLETLEEGTHVHVIGRTTDGGWFKVAWPGSGGGTGFAVAEGLMDGASWTAVQEQRAQEAKAQEEAKTREEEEKAEEARKRLAKAEYRCGKELERAKAECKQAGEQCAQQKAAEFGGGLNGTAAALIALSCTTEVSMCNSRVSEDYDTCVEAHR